MRRGNEGAGEKKEDVKLFIEETVLRVSRSNVT